jgi:hypothetical protein
MATNMNTGLGRTDVRRVDQVCDARLATVNRIARLVVDGETGLARLHRLSNAAVELSSIMILQIGHIIQVDLSETISKRATVVASDNGRHTLLFQHQIDCAELLRELVAEARSARARPLRLTTPATPAVGRSTNGLHQLELGNISQRGMMVRHSGSFQEGLRVWVQLPNGRECRGVVRWAKEDCAGLELIDILSVNELGAISELGRGMN